MGLVGEVNVLQFGGIPRLLNALAEFGREFALLLNGLEDSGFALIQFKETVVLIGYLADLYLIQTTRALFAVAGYEGNRRMFIKQGNSGCHLRSSHSYARRNDCRKISHPY